VCKQINDQMSSCSVSPSPSSPATAQAISRIKERLSTRVHTAVRRRHYHWPDKGNGQEENKEELNLKKKTKKTYV
jgi:hypothetical protein